MSIFKKTNSTMAMILKLLKLREANGENVSSELKETKKTFETAQKKTKMLSDALRSAMKENGANAIIADALIDAGVVANESSSLPDDLESINQYVLSTRGDAMKESFDNLAILLSKGGYVAKLNDFKTIEESSFVDDCHYDSAVIFQNNGARAIVVKLSSGSKYIIVQAGNETQACYTYSEALEKKVFDSISKDKLNKDTLTLNSVFDTKQGVFYHNQDETKLTLMAARSSMETAIFAIQSMSYKLGK